MCSTFLLGGSTNLVNVFLGSVLSQPLQLSSRKQMTKNSGKKVEKSEPTLVAGKT